MLDADSNQTDWTLPNMLCLLVDEVFLNWTVLYMELENIFDCLRGESTVTSSSVSLLGIRIMACYLESVMGSREVDLRRFLLCK